jgi:hypothetical protein
MSDKAPEGIGLHYLMQAARANAASPSIKSPGHNAVMLAAGARAAAMAASLGSQSHMAHHARRRFEASTVPNSRAGRPTLSEQVDRIEAAASRIEAALDRIETMDAELFGKD